MHGATPVSETEFQKTLAAIVPGSPKSTLVPEIVSPAAAAAAAALFRCLVLSAVARTLHIVQILLLLPRNRPSGRGSSHLRQTCVGTPESHSS